MGVETGSTDEAIKSPGTDHDKKPYTICFVCTANMCRSAMAQGLMKERVARHGLEGQIRVVGGGTHAGIGYRATNEARQVLADRGIDISDHRSRPTDTALMSKSDLVLTATSDQVRSLSFEFPDQVHKVNTLRGYGKPDHWQGIVDVDDPVGQGPEAYQVTADLLEEQLERIWPLVVEAARENIRNRSHREVVFTK